MKKGDTVQIIKKDDRLFGRYGEVVEVIDGALVPIAHIIVGDDPMIYAQKYLRVVREAVEASL